MAINHSRAGRTKSPDAKVVVPSWDSVWESFTADNGKTTVETMNSEGWKTIAQVAQIMDLSRARINQMAIEGKFELTKRRIFQGGLTREMNFIRPQTDK